MKRLVIVLGFAVLATTACGAKYAEQFKDTHVNGHISNGATVIQQPDGFNNVARTCDGTTAVYTIFHNDGRYGSVAVAEDAKVCGGSR